MNNSPKITTSELVLSAIFFLQQKNGVTSRDITKFICEKRKCKQNQVREEVKKALEKATQKGVFVKKRGLYRIKSSFGKNIISQNVRNLENRQSDTNNKGATDSYPDYGKKIFNADSLSRQNPFSNRTKLSENGAFESSFYFRRNEDDFGSQSGENISVERLRVCRSDDDDDFLEDDEYDDDDVDFFADEQTPAPEDASSPPRQSSSQDLMENVTSSKEKERDDQNASASQKKNQKAASGYERSRRPEKRATLQDDEDDDEFDLDYEGEESGKEGMDSKGKYFKKETKENDRKEKKFDENQSVDTESSENAETLKEETWAEDEEYFDNTDFNSPKLRLNCDGKFQKLYNSKEKKNADFQKDVANNSNNDKVDPKKTAEYGNVGISMRSTDRQEVLSEPESSCRKSKRERSSSLFRSSKISATNKRKQRSYSKPIKHRKFN